MGNDRLYQHGMYDLSSCSEEEFATICSDLSYGDWYLYVDSPHAKAVWKQHKHGDDNPPPEKILQVAAGWGNIALLIEKMHAPAITANENISGEVIKNFNDEMKNIRVMSALEQTSFIKADTAKPNLAILLDTPKAMEEVARVLEYGAAKYDRKNWAKCDDPERYMAAALRHLTAYHNGQILDPESGRSHLAHAICSLLFLEEMRSER